MKNKISAILFCFVAFAPTPLNTKMLSSDKNPIILVLVFVTVLSVIWYNSRKGVWNWKDFGFRTDKESINVQSVSFYCMMMLVYALGFLLLYKGVRPIVPINATTVMLSLLSAFAQQTIFQGYLFNVGYRIFDEDYRIVVPLTVILFVTMHLFFKSVGWMEIGLLTLGGIGFTLSYKKYPNIFLVTALHWMTNVLALHMGMFPSFHF